LTPAYIPLKDGSEFALYDHTLSHTRRWLCAVAKIPFLIIYSKFSISFQRREPLQNNNLVLKLPMENLNVWKYVVRRELSFDEIGNTIVVEDADKIGYKKRRRTYLSKF
jgi:hypothetical protein